MFERILFVCPDSQLAVVGMLKIIDTFEVSILSIRYYNNSVSILCYRYFSVSLFIFDTSVRFRVRHVQGHKFSFTVKSVKPQILKRIFKFNITHASHSNMSRRVWWPWRSLKPARFYILCQLSIISLLLFPLPPFRQFRPRVEHLLSHECWVYLFSNEWLEQQFW